MGKEKRVGLTKCCACPKFFRGRARSLARKMGEKSGTGVGFDCLCLKCYFEYDSWLKNRRTRCEVCQKGILGQKTYIIHPNHRPFLPPDMTGARFFCRACYDSASEKSKAAPSGGVPSPSAMDLGGEGGNFPAQKQGAERTAGASVGPERRTQSLTKTEFQQMARDLVDHRFAGHALEDVIEYERHVDGNAGGLFSLLLSALPNDTVATKRKLAMILELFGHLVDPTYSKTVWELTEVLHSVGASDRQMRGFCEKGLAMCSSKLHQHWKLENQRHDSRLSKIIGAPGQQLMLVTDDFHQIERGRGVPKKNGRFNAAFHVANAILKDMTNRGPYVPVSEYPECVTPAVCSVDAVVAWAAEVWERLRGKFYFGTRLKFLEKIASTLQPYGGSDADDSWDNPISMGNVTLFKCYDNPFKKPEDIDAVYVEISQALMASLALYHMPATGDWYAFSNLYYLRLSNPAQFGHFIPIPGAFHVGLNAQQAVFSTFSPIITQVWKAVFPRKKLDPDPDPRERKFALEIACEAWKKCRTCCLTLVANLDKVPVDVIFMLNFFEEFLPLCLDAYALFLSSDFGRYEEVLLRLLRMFIQLGKNHYVLCTCIFVANLMHWKTHLPNLYCEMRAKLRFCSEEEVEIFHSLIRPHVRSKKSSKEVALEVNAYGGNMKMLQTWRPHKPKRKGCIRKAAQLTTERILTASRTVNAMFKKGISVDSPCTEAEKPGHLLSRVLGEFDESGLPYCLQRASVRLRGCGAIRNEDREECDGWVDIGSRRLCGHGKAGKGSCQACLASTAAVVREMMTQSTIRGLKIA